MDLLFLPSLPLPPSLTPSPSSDTTHYWVPALCLAPGWAFRWGHRAALERLFLQEHGGHLTGD